MLDTRLGSLPLTVCRKRSEEVALPAAFVSGFLFTLRPLRTAAKTSEQNAEDWPQGGGGEPTDESGPVGGSSE